MKMYKNLDKLLTLEEVSNGCPNHGGQTKKTYKFSRYVTGPEVDTFTSCKCAIVSGIEDNTRIQGTVSLYCHSYTQAAGLAKDQAAKDRNFERKYFR